MSDAALIDEAEAHLARVVSRLRTLAGADAASDSVTVGRLAQELVDEVDAAATVLAGVTSAVTQNALRRAAQADGEGPVASDRLLRRLRAAAQLRGHDPELVVADALRRLHGVRG
jgi:glucose-6-phosphate dehydrogenase assembly protein OpcA